MGESISDLTDSRTTAVIAGALEDYVVSIDTLTPHPENARRGDVTALADSLERFGQVKPVLTTLDGTIVAGHHVFYAARHLGWDKIAVVKSDLDPDTARAYLVADNRLSEMGGYDMEGLGRLLEEVQAYSGGLTGTGYTEKDVDRFFKDLAGGGDGPPERAPGSEDDPGVRPTTITCPSCGAEQ